jgi:uncharacterized membrane protein YkvA (DUF1232 family)
MNLMKQIWRMAKMTRRAGGMQGITRLAQDGPKYVTLLRRLFLDVRVPIWAKAMVVAGVVFAFSPLNLPQYIPILGQLDDIGIVLFVGNLFFKQVPAEALVEHKRAVGLEPWPSRA